MPSQNQKLLGAENTWHDVASSWWHKLASVLLETLALRICTETNSSKRRAKRTYICFCPEGSHTPKWLSFVIIIDNHHDGTIFCIHSVFQTLCSFYIHFLIKSSERPCEVGTIIISVYRLRKWLVRGIGWIWTQNFQVLVHSPEYCALLTPTCISKEVKIWVTHLISLKAKG